MLLGLAPAQTRQPEKNRDGSPRWGRDGECVPEEVSPRAADEQSDAATPSRPRDPIVVGTL